MLIRKAQPQDALAIARVHVDSWRTTYADIVSSEFLASLTYERREVVWRNWLAEDASQSFVFVAETADREVIGFASAGPERDGDDTYQGEIYALYLLQHYQRQGIGRRLFEASARELQQRNVTTLLIWVLEANPALKFYEALGGQYLHTKEIEIGNQRLLERAYGWKDTRITTREDCP